MIWFSVLSDVLMEKKKLWGFLSFLQTKKMPFKTTIAVIRAKIQARDDRQVVKDEKTLSKYRSIINDKLRTMKRTEEHVFFRNGNVQLLEHIVDELIEDGFKARVYRQYVTYPEGVHLLIEVPTIDECTD